MLGSVIGAGINVAYNIGSAIESGGTLVPVNIAQNATRSFLITQTVQAAIRQGAVIAAYNGRIDACRAAAGLPLTDTVVVF